MKRFIAFTICAALILSFASMCFAEDVSDKATFGLSVDAEDYYLERGDTVTVTVSLMTSYIVGSISAIVYYDNTYFEPSLGGAQYITVHSGNTGAITGGFIKMIDNPDAVKTQDWNVWENGLVTGRVNSRTPLAMFYPESWRVSTTELKDAYKTYDFVQVGVALNAASPSNGYSVMASPEQKLFSFELRVKNDAPYTGDFNAKILMSSDAFRTDTNVYTKNHKIYATKLSYNEYSSTNVADLYGMDYVLKNAEQNFRITESGFVPDPEECTEHDWVGVVTTEPTLFGKGVITYTCSVCNESYTEETESLFNQWFHATWIYVNILTPLLALFK